MKKFSICRHLSQRLGRREEQQKRKLNYKQTTVYKYFLTISFLTAIEEQVMAKHQSNRMSVEPNEPIMQNDLYAA